MVGRTQYVYTVNGIANINVVPGSTVSTTKIFSNVGNDIVFIKDITDYDSIVTGVVFVTFPDDVAVTPIDYFPGAPNYNTGDLTYYAPTGKVYKSLIDANVGDPVTNANDHEEIPSVTLTTGINVQV